MTTFSVDKFGWVTATLPDKGKLRTQSVESHLLFAILRHLERRHGNVFELSCTETPDSPATGGEGK